MILLKLGLSAPWKAPSSLLLTCSVSQLLIMQRMWTVSHSTKTVFILEIFKIYQLYKPPECEHYGWENYWFSKELDIECLGMKSKSFWFDLISHFVCRSLLRVPVSTKQQQKNTATKLKPQQQIQKHNLDSKWKGSLLNITCLFLIVHAYDYHKGKRIAQFVKQQNSSETI